MVTGDWKGRRRGGGGATSEGADRSEASRARVEALCREAVAALEAAGAPRDVTHVGRRRRRWRRAELVVLGTGWDLGRYVVWPDATLREVEERLGWVEESTGTLRLRGGESPHLAGEEAPAPTGGVWAVCAPVEHVDVARVGARSGVVVADEGTSRWADHPHGRPDRRHPGARDKPVADWPDLAVDLPERVRRRTRR